ncbi:MAG: T9SS type A sorting domain-containing protein [Saprospiraceae bacterium]|nr:T9SS type A sorting domain-containing protein [Saprospiraceae bacterium]
MYRTLYTLATILIACLALNAQTETLLKEDFNSCELTAGWNVVIDGNPDAVWYIGTPRNPQSDSSSIDGTCMLIIDDDATGDNTPAYIWKMTSPEFSGNRHSNLIFTADVHLRDAGESFRILLDNGTELIELRKFEGRNYSGTQFSEFVKVSVDLSFYQSDNMRLIFEYNDNSKWGWWAGVDNILVEGSGNADILIAENFDKCETPQGWTAIIENGELPWTIGKVNNGNAGTNVSMNGTCFMFFDDDLAGEFAEPSRVTMLSPVFDGTKYATYALSFDLIFRTYSQTEYFEVGVLDNGRYRPVHVNTTQVAGNNFSVFENISLDLSKFKGENLQLYFKYDDSGGWNWWVGIDNIKLVGEGSVNDFCAKALPINVGEDCIEFDMEVAFAAQDIPMSCNSSPTGTLWYSFDQTQNGVLEAHVSGSNFNDIIEIFKGDQCADLEPVICKDRDEYGFYGEKSTQVLEAGKYFIRVSGKAAEFGKGSGQGCLKVMQLGTEATPPANEDCGNARQIEINQPCIVQTNLDALNPENFPSINERSRADVWFSFTALDESALSIISGSDFSDVLTIWEGNCDQLSEVISNEHGAELIFKDPVPGKTYLLQLSGYFSTLEGASCLEIKTVELETTNDLCTTAKPLTLNADCESSNNSGATFSGIIPACDPLADADVWYTFTASESNMYLRNKSEFLSTISIYKGDCQELESVFCNKTQHACDGYLHVSNLEAGQEYFIQIASRGKFPGLNRGSTCVEIISPSNLPDWEPLTVSAQAVCVSKNAVLILPEATGGAGNYSFTGNALLSPILSLEEYHVEATDSDGCVDFFRGIAPDCSQMDCNVFFEIETTSLKCFGESDGKAGIEIAGGVSPYNYEWSNNATSSNIENLVAGTYSVTVSDRGGCEEVLTFEIEQPEALVITTEVIDEVYGQGVITLNVNGGTAPYTYWWSIGGNSFEDDNVLDNLTPGTYSARIIDANGCEITTGDLVITQTTSTVSGSLPSGMQMYPNPVANELILAFKANFQGEWNVRVLSGTSQLLISEKINLQQGGKLMIDVSELLNGMYFIDIIQGDKIYSSKFIKH